MSTKLINFENSDECFRIIDANNINGVRVIKNPYGHIIVDKATVGKMARIRIVLTDTEDLEIVRY